MRDTDCFLDLILLSTGYGVIPPPSPTKGLHFLVENNNKFSFHNMDMSGYSYIGQPTPYSRKLLSVINLIESVLIDITQQMKIFRPFASKSWVNNEDFTTRFLQHFSSDFTHFQTLLSPSRYKKSLLSYLFSDDQEYLTRLGAASNINIKNIEILAKAEDLTRSSVNDLSSYLEYFSNYSAESIATLQVELQQNIMLNSLQSFLSSLHMQRSTLYAACNTIKVRKSCVLLNYCLSLISIDFYFPVLILFYKG